MKFVLILATLLATQVSSVPLTSNVRSILDIAQAALDAANKVVDTLLSNFHQQLEALKEAVFDLAKASETAVRAAINAINKKILKELEENKNHNATGENAAAVISCVETASTEIEQAGNAAANVSSKCIAKSSNDVITAFETIVDDVKDGNAGIKEIQDHLTSCKESDKLVKCVKSVLLEISNEVGNISSTVYKDILKADQIFIDLGHQLDKCVGDVVETLLQEGNKILNDVSTCIKNSTPQ